jgi:uncharacterized protein YraI
MNRKSTLWLSAGLLTVCVLGTTASAVGIGDTFRLIANLNVRTGPGTNYPEITDPDYHDMAPAGTKGKVLAGPQSANGYTWWRADFGPGLYSGWAVIDGLQTVSPAQSLIASVILTLYVHGGGVNGPAIPGARVTGRDGAGSSFDQTTNSSGYVLIAGKPGNWSFTATKTSYQSNSWSQDITSTCTKHAFLQGLPTPPPVTQAANARRPSTHVSRHRL